MSDSKQQPKPDHHNQNRNSESADQLEWTKYSEQTGEANFLGQSEDNHITTHSSLSRSVQNLHLHPESLETPKLNKSRDLPSPFSQGSRLGYVKPPHQPLSNPLKLKTTPEVLHEESASCYLNSKPQTSGSRNEQVSPMSVVETPISQITSAYTPTLESAPGQRSITSGGGQAAEMQARILALQRSRSKRTTPSVSARPSPQLQPVGRRSSSSSSASTIPPIHLPGSSRNSVSTPDTEDDECLDKPRSYNLGTPCQERAPSEPQYQEYIHRESASHFENNSDSRTSNSSHRSISQNESQIEKQAHSSFSKKSPEASPRHASSNDFDPNTVISPSAASFAASGPISLMRASSFRSKQRSSLSARRGMKLDGMNSPTISSPRSPPSQNSTKDRIVAQNRSVRGPVDSGAGLVPKEKGNRGLFRDYRKYIDIETGSLNFAGKACVHAQGIEFSSGEKFSISMDKLEFMCELGAGNYGTVQKVLHVPNGVFMAVKEIRLELDEASLRQIIMELDVLHRCDMQNIIAFYGAFFVEGSVYICMEYMNGGSINKIYGGGVPERYLKYVVRCVVIGLKQLKEQFNIIHRDVKPTNILCSTDGHVKLCDFGVSGNLVASIARTNVGCQAYMAPERIKVDKFDTESTHQPMTYTAESDIWSLGLSIIEMAKGSYPYPSDSYASIFSQLNAIVEDPSPALDPTKYSPEACDFVNKLLYKQPHLRPKYADIVKHPWLAKEDCTMEEFGNFVYQRLAHQGGGDSKVELEQPTVTASSSIP